MLFSGMTLFLLFCSNTKHAFENLVRQSYVQPSLYLHLWANSLTSHFANMVCCSCICSFLWVLSVWAYGHGGLAGGELGWS